MAKRNREKEARRQRQLAQEHESEERAKRRKYVGLGVALIAIAAITVAIVTSSTASSSTPIASTPQTSAAAPAATGPAAAAAARAVLVANMRQADRVLNTTIQAKLAQLGGVPVVINQWASWCPNCRAEFPFFQQASRRYAKRIAFLGLDSQDSQANAQAFLGRFPVDYPSVFDQNASQAQSLGAGQGWPTTIYLNAKHQITNVHVGAYPSVQSLEQDISHYT
ncbi:MAG: TlpA family protein disulfide reductase [Solirubrobacteraceae bacterium]